MNSIFILWFLIKANHNNLYCMYWRIKEKFMASWENTVFNRVMIFYNLNSIKKIHIGYVLKSADVLTLVSRRYSENSSNTHTCRHQCTSAHFHTHMHTRTHPRTCMYTCAHPHSAHTPHIPTDALNLINHMKLHVNTVIWKKGDRRRRKRKEQESAEAISGLKSQCHVSFEWIMPYWYFDLKS